MQSLSLIIVVFLGSFNTILWFRVINYFVNQITRSQFQTLTRLNLKLPKEIRALKPDGMPLGYFVKRHSLHREILDDMMRVFRLNRFIERHIKRIELNSEYTVILQDIERRNTVIRLSTFIKTHLKNVKSKSRNKYPWLRVFS